MSQHTIERWRAALQNGSSQQDRKRKIAPGTALCSCQHFHIETERTSLPSFSPALMLSNQKKWNPA